MADGNRLIQIMPAPGWRVAYADKDRGEAFVHPLFGWGLTADGDVVPLACDGCAFVSDVTEFRSFVCVIPPEVEDVQAYLDEFNQGEHQTRFRLTKPSG